MRWTQAHVGNIRQVPIGDQEVVNPEMKVPDEQNPLVEEEELEPAPTRRDAPPAPDKPKDPDKPRDPHATPVATSAHDKPDTARK